MSDESEQNRAGDDLAALVAQVQAAADSGELPSRIRMRLVVEGVEPETADAIVARVYHAQPLSERYREASRDRVARIHREEGGSGASWMFWVGGLVVLNVLSWLFHWGFWIY
jgi:hypothetical protein